MKYEKEAKMFKLPEQIKIDIVKYKRSLEELKTGGLSYVRFKGVREIGRAHV